MSDSQEEVVAQIALILSDRGTLPMEVQTDVDSAVRTWASGAPDVDLLAGVKSSLWAYLTAKHGDSTTIADHQDRSVRAALCVAAAPGGRDPADLLEWAALMLLRTDD